MSFLDFYNSKPCEVFINNNPLLLDFNLKFRREMDTADTFNLDITNYPSPDTIENIDIYWGGERLVYITKNELQITTSFSNVDRITQITADEVGFEGALVFQEGDNVASVMFPIRPNIIFTDDWKKPLTSSYLYDTNEKSLTIILQEISKSEGYKTTIPIGLESDEDIEVPSGAETPELPRNTFGLIKEEGELLHILTNKVIFLGYFYKEKLIIATEYNFNTRTGMDCLVELEPVEE